MDKSHITIVQTLLKAGANINAAAKVRIMSNPCLNGGGKNGPSITPLYRLSATYTTDILPDMQSPSVVYYTSALSHYALLNKPHTSIKFCLLACPSQDGYTPLHIATDRGRRTVVQTLIDYGADIYAAEKVRGQIILSCDDYYHRCRSCDITA